MSEELATLGSSARMLKPYPAYKDTGLEWVGEVPEHGNNENVIFQTGFTGSTGYVLSFNPVIMSRITKPQSFAIPVTTYEMASPSRRGTQMTRIARISTDLRAPVSSVQTVFYRNPSAFICVYLRLIFVSLSDRIQEIQFKLSPIINENGCISRLSIIFGFKKPQRSQRTQRKRQSSVFSECSVVLESLSRMKSKCPFFLLKDNTWRSL